MLVKELLKVNPKHWSNKKLTAVDHFFADGSPAEIEYDVKAKGNEWILNSEFDSFSDDLEETTFYLRG